MSELIRKSVNVSTGGVLGKKKVKSKSKTLVMPTPDDAAIALAKKKSVARQRGRTGRVSTILSQGAGYGG